MGYSMGARIAAFLTVDHPARVRSVVLGGLGIRMVEGVGLPDNIAEALEAPSLADVSDPTGRAVPLLRRADQIRSQGARRLHPRLAPDLAAASRSPVSACRCWLRSGPKTTWRAPRKN